MTAEDIANLALVPLVVVFGVIAVRARRAGRLRLGLGRRGALRAYGLGLGLGGSAVVLIVGTLLAVGAAEFTGWGIPGSATAVWVGLVVYLALLNLVEEIAFQALLLQGVLEVLGRSPRMIALGVVAVGVLTSLPYLLGPATSALSMVSAVLGGITYGVAYLRAGSVWFPAGMRAAWNIVLGPVLGFTVSANVLAPTWGHPLVEGPGWVTGGAYGPEAGIVAILVRILLLAALLVLPLARATRTSTDPHRPSAPTSSAAH